MPHDVDVDVLDFLERLEIRNLDIGEEEIAFSCPFSGHLHGDEKQSAYFNRQKQIFYCHGCKRRGNVVTFLSEYENISPMKAFRYLREFYGQGFRMPDGGSISHELEKFWEEKPRERTVNEWIGEEHADERLVDWHAVEAAGDEAPERLRYILNRGFSPDVLIDWKIGFDPISDRICIPVRNEKGQLVGFKGRSWNPLQEPKYMVLGDKRSNRYGFKTYEKGLVVFGLERVVGGSKVVVAEGELDAIALSALGYHAVACEGSHISAKQERLIKDRALELVLFFDDDKAGQDATADALDRFQKHMPVSVVESHEGDPASLQEEEVHRLIGESTPGVQLMVAI